MKTLKIASLVGFAMLGLVAQSSAATTYVVPASGYKWGGNNYIVSLEESAVCNRVPVTTTYWVTPIPITSTDRDYDGYAAHIPDSGSSVCSRMVSSNSNGTLAGVTACSSNSNLNAVNVPLNGNLAVHTTLSNPFSGGIYACLGSVRAWSL